MVIWDVREAKVLIAIKNLHNGIPISDIVFMGEKSLITADASGKVMISELKVKSRPTRIKK